MIYEDLIQNWLEAKGTPKRGIRADPKYPAYGMSPDNINIFLNSGLEPFDMYHRPDATPARMDYSTVAVNPDNLGALFAEGEAKTGSMIREPDQAFMEKNYSWLPKFMHPLIPQAIYEHELGHFYDKNMPTFGQGSGKHTPEEIRKREQPAWNAEDRFWDKAFDAVNSGRRTIFNRAVRRIQ
jgi:hypothetical protein